MTDNQAVAEMTNNFAMPMRRRTWRGWLRYRLFGQRHCHLPPAPGHWKDSMFTEVYTYLGFLDRLRILISGRVKTTVKTITENEIGGHNTTGELNVMPPILFIEPSTDVWDY